jgi:hypothetical protein
MNERIRELLLQAGGIYHNDDGDELTPALVGKGLEKFAELIVRECINNYRRKHGEYLRTGRYIDEYEHSNNMLTELGFKEHFGVEE